MNIKNLVEKKLRDMPASPELKEEIAGLVQDAVEHDDLFMLMGPVYLFHEGALFNTKLLSDEEYEEFMGFVPNVVVDENGYVENIEYLTEKSLFDLVKRYRLLSLTARILEARAVAWDRLWEIAKRHAEAPFEMQEAVVLRGNRAIQEWDIGALEDSVLTWHLEGQEISCGLYPEEAKKLLDSWGITDLVKELIG